MQALRIALAQINPTVGDLDGNAALIVSWTRRAVEEGAQVVLFPEMALTGYPVEDLALIPSFAEACTTAIRRLADALDRAGCGGVVTVVGYLDRDIAGARNSAAVLFAGEVVSRYDKVALPTYRVFDEARYFAPGTHLSITTVGEHRVGVVVCEDIWQPGGPVPAYAAAGVDALLCLNASPFELGKDTIRRSVVDRRAAEAGVPVAYVNLVGGQDELVFDGGSMVVAADGELLGLARPFTEDLLCVDVDLPGDRTPDDHPDGWTVDRNTLSDIIVRGWDRRGRSIAEPVPDEEQVWAALVTGLRDYVHKNGFRTVALGLSGGIDSAVVAAIAVDALGSDAVHGVSMPSRYSSDHSRSDADEFARRTGIRFTTEPIESMVEVFVRTLGLTGLAEENIQARCRGMTLMALSNSDGHLILATGNKSELAVGYSTIYGDAVGGYAPIKDVPKSLVWDLARWRNKTATERGEIPPIPEDSIDKPPSAELRPGQLDTDSLPDYDELDAILYRYVDCDQGLRDIVAAGYDRDTVADILRKVDASEYKRRQYPIGAKVTSRAFGRDRRMPITNRFRSHDDPM
ncbi:NAD+ synthase [Rhodococcoides kyotonense]|uniref:Glutamine-dependent NAD(+) synthetase n=1 Tax=Rhodococcoides kyotonense TaxID=398843 RepID=A0A239KZ16_9NOCA|nr:NAD+ synthase [Rhodococcus kyotonensis]SNT23290.1 NAD+ synthase (glutamine-hydrolysing) [Rhodococcus kyotonensis]